MKIAITTYSLSYGGVGNFILDLAQFLIKNAHEIEIICTDSPGAWFSRIEKIGAKSKKFNFGIWGWIPFGRLIHTMHVGKYVKSRKFDLIINNHSYFVHASGSCFRPKVKFITVIHNQLPSMVSAECSSVPDLVICVSNRIYKQAINYSRGNKTITILNGAKFPAHIEREMNLDEGKSIKLIFVGRLDDRQKAVLRLPEIVSELKTRGNVVQLSIIGDGPDAFRIKEIINQKGLQDNIQFLGLIDAEKIAEFYQSHHIFILPSNFEGLPLTLIEAMGNGCVPVVSNLPESTDICVQQGVNGYLIEPGNIGGFVEKIESLIKNPTLLAQMSKESIKIANENFSLERAHNNYLKVIKELFSEVGPTDKIGKLQGKRKFFNWKDIIPYHMVMKIKGISKRNKQ